MVNQEITQADAVPPIQPAPLATNIINEALDIDEQNGGSSSEEQDMVSRKRTVVIISSVTSVTFVLSFLNGLVTVGIPVIAPDIGLDPSLILWFVVSFSLSYAF